MKKERWGLTILVFLAIAGIFTFLVLKGGRPVVSDELVFAVRLDAKASGGMLYNYHLFRQAALKAVPPESEPEASLGVPERGSGPSATGGKGMSETGSAGKSTTGSSASGAGKSRGFIYHKVQSGDSLWRIAKKYNAEIGDIVRDNAIRDPNVIFAGATLKISLKLS